MMAQQLTASDVEAIFPEVSGIASNTLRNAVIEIWREIAAEMAWEDLRVIPKNNGAEKHRSLVGHTRGVTQMAVHICETAKALHGRDYDRDLLLAACLLHDVSKPVESEPLPDAPETVPGVAAGRTSKLGKNVPHAVYATAKIFAHGLPVELAHLVATHTHSSNERGKTWEASAIFYADFADSDAARSMVQGKMYSERWHLT
jgi:HD superfamily phosphohydrolase YqeK